MTNAPIEDEEIGEEEEQAVARAMEWFKNHQGIPFEQVVAELGFTMDEILDHPDPAALAGLVSRTS